MLSSGFKNLEPPYRCLPSLHRSDTRSGVRPENDMGRLIRCFVDGDTFESALARMSSDDGV